MRNGESGGGCSCCLGQGWQGVQTDEIGRGDESAMQACRAMLGEAETVLLALHRLSGGNKRTSGGGFAEWVIVGGCPSCEFAHIFGVLVFVWVSPAIKLGA
jgi:hypothetical protein